MSHLSDTIFNSTFLCNIFFDVLFVLTTLQLFWLHKKIVLHSSAVCNQLKHSVLLLIHKNSSLSRACNAWKSWCPLVKRARKYCKWPNDTLFFHMLFELTIFTLSTPWRHKMGSFSAFFLQKVVCETATKKKQTVELLLLVSRAASLLWFGMFSPIALSYSTNFQRQGKHKRVQRIMLSVNSWRTRSDNG